MQHGIVPWHRCEGDIFQACQQEREAYTDDDDVYSDGTPQRIKLPRLTGSYRECAQQQRDDDKHVCLDGEVAKEIDEIELASLNNRRDFGNDGAKAKQSK